eukprot:jgi/Ulvmu1/11415/UM075_0077.1
MVVSSISHPPESEIGVDESVSASFHGSKYAVSIRTIDHDTLRVEVEQMSNASIWKGTFTKQYITEITSKTGNFKSYSVFVTMLASALRRTSDSVCVDLLTYSDLEVLKAKRLRRSGHEVPMPASYTTNNKRYLILTYQGEFDKVHYPLPLQFEEHPDPGELKKTIIQLRDQLSQSQTSATDTTELLEEVHQLRADNDDLHRQLAEAADDQARGTSDINAMAEDAYQEAQELRRENSSLQETLEALQEQLRDLRLSHRRELRLKSREAAAAHDELQAARAKVRELNVKLRHVQAELDSLNSAAANRGRARAAPLYGGPTRNRSGGARARDSGPPRPRSMSPYVRADATPPRPPKYQRSRPISGRSSAASDTSRASTSSRPRSTVSRAASAPALPGRFDPTAYVRQKRAKEAMGSASARATFSPSSANPRTSSRGRARANYSPRPARSDGHRSVTVSPAAHRTRSTAAARPPSGRSGGGPDCRERPRPSGSPSQEVGRLSAERQRERAWGRGSTPEAPRRTSAERGRRPTPKRRPQWDSRTASVSPGRALLQVKEKIAQYRSQGRGADGCGSEGGGGISTLDDGSIIEPGAGCGHEPDDTQEEATAEIQEIDSRLQALQEFLRSARAANGQT